MNLLPQINLTLGALGIVGPKKSLLIQWFPFFRVRIVK